MEEKVNKRMSFFKDFMIGVVVMVPIAVVIALSVSWLMGVGDSEKDLIPESNLPFDPVGAVYCGDSDGCSYLVRIFEPDRRIKDYYLENVALNWAQVGDTVVFANLVPYGSLRPVMVFDETDKFWIKKAKTGKMVLCTFDCSSP